MTDDNFLKASKPAPEGWVLQSHPQTFSAHAGPFYFREEGAEPGVGFYSEPHHGNLGQMVHGGALMTLADMALFDAAFREEGQFAAVTVTMNAEFLYPGPIGEFIQARGEVVKAGKGMIFVRGLVSVKDKKLLAFSGSLKRLF
ncbi:MAG: thioesterase [Hyphococcus sp.]|nr:MAG: thioesterase [Marinicaulis sp.]